MPDYQKMYITLFNQITDTIEELQKIQQQTEAMYIEHKEADEKWNRKNKRKNR